MSDSSNPEEKSRPTPTVEDYLMTMHAMERDFGEIVAARLAEMMGVAPATVAVTLKRMERDNWVASKGRGDIRLTKTGREAAHSVVRRHMLTEWLLVKVFQIPIYETHDEAHQIEHAISPKLEERMQDFLGNPKLCPHGNPFPGSEALTKKWVPLLDAPVGKDVVIRRIHEFAENNQDLLDFLGRSKIEPGVKVFLSEKMSFNETLVVDVSGENVTLGFMAAKYIFVETP